VFWHVDGHEFLACWRTPSFWHIDGHSLACWRKQTCLACRGEQPFWHVDGSFGMLTRRIPPSERSCEDLGEIRYEVLVWSSRGPCAKILWKSWWHSLKDLCLISNIPCIRGACIELLWDVVGVSCKKILTVRSSQEGPCMTLLSDSLCGLGMKILSWSREKSSCCCCCSDAVLRFLLWFPSPPPGLGSLAGIISITGHDESTGQASAGCL